MRANIKNEDGKEIGNPSGKFSSKEKLKRIEDELYDAEEQSHMLSHYRPSATVLVRASDGKIVSVEFRFNNLKDCSAVDTKKLRKLQEKIMAEITMENLLFGGQRAVSGYMLAPMWFFKP